MFLLSYMFIRYNIKQTSAVSNHLLESYYIQENLSPHSEHKSIAIVDDVYMLFNQQRLDRMTGAALSDWLARTSQSSSQLSSLRSRMTDAQLGSFIKSRYIQSHSELLAWSSYLESQYPEMSVETSQEQPAEPSAESSAE